MPLLDEGTRFLIDTLKSRINEVVFGFDGTFATQQDSTDTTDFMRYTYNSIEKNSNNEILFSALIEVTI